MLNNVVSKMSYTNFKILKWENIRCKWERNQNSLDLKIQIHRQFLKCEEMQMPNKIMKKSSSSVPIKLTQIETIRYDLRFIILTRIKQL